MKKILLILLISSLKNYAQVGCNILQDVSLNNLASLSLFKFDIHGTTACTQYDEIQMIGSTSVQLGGILEIVLGSYMPSIGSEYKLIDNQGTGNITGNFISTIFPSLSSGFFQLRYPNTPLNTSNDLILAVVSSLPITMISIDADSKDCEGILLSWETGSEINCDFYQIEKSLDGINFEIMEKINARNKASKYSFADIKKLESGIPYFYKLKQVDFDGKFEYFEFPSTRFECNKNSNIEIFKLSENELGLKNLNFSAFSDYKFEIYNSNGTKMKTVKLSADQNTVDLHDLFAGFYFIKSSYPPFIAKFVKNN